ncbi:MAG TPA: FmdB family zinc ribbon protein [Myxococcota bacterium]
MPTYEYRCPNCGKDAVMVVRIEERGGQKCDCGTLLDRKISAVPARFVGRQVQGGGPDRFTADVLGVPFRDLPDSLRAETKRETA